MFLQRRREHAPAERPRSGGALILVTRRLGPALKSKALLACEMATDEDIKALEQMEKQ